MPIISFWLVHCTEDPVLYFAEVLEKALDKPNSKTVTRIILTRAEVCRAPTTPFWSTQFPALFYVCLLHLISLSFRFCFH